MVRVKRRYFVFQFHFNSNPTTIIKSSHIHTTFETMISRLYGDMLQTTATFIAKLTNNSIECSIQTLHVGGSIRQCKKYLVNYCIEQLLFINAQSINRNQATSQLFKKKKKKQTLNKN
ncbi:unnamed protein product [Rotaria magnacalcarata]|uniref:Uncharacterized protein n=2 Tax=Rotaria magnacalcarata TaxID=392030 RepID=A0A816WZM1_9BILA|nr:unnamed protein product [Rotaria magnacalcarata]